MPLAHNALDRGIGLSSGGVIVNNSMAALASRVAGRLEPVLDDIVAVLRIEVPGYWAGEGLPDDDVREPLRTCLNEVLDELRGAAINGPSAVIEQQMRRRAEQGLALPDILHSYRLGVSHLWRALAANATDGDTGALIAATPTVFDLLDRYSLRAGEIHHEIALRNARRDEQVRATLLDTVLTRDPTIGEAFWDAVARLGVPREGHFAIAQVPNSKHDLENRLARLPGVAGAWFRVGPHSQAGLICLHNGKTDRWKDVLGTAGLSAAYFSIAGTPRARAQSQIAAAAISPGRPIVQYDRDLLPVLVASAPDAAAVLVEETLGPVLEQPPDRRDAILDTVRSWLMHGQSVSAAAHAMYCHRNTVNYRIRRFQELTGRPLTDHVWLAQVVLALEATASNVHSGSRQDSAEDG